MDYTDYAHGCDIPCHGKSFKVGMLFDCRTEEILEACRLWEVSKILDPPEPEVPGEFHDTVLIEEETEEKRRDFGASADASITFMSSIEAKASTGYRYGSVSSQKTARATLASSCFTSCKEMDSMKIKANLDDNIYESAGKVNFLGATHVVVKVMYGCEAFFEFTRSIGEEETKHVVHAEMRTALNGIPKAGGGAGVGISYARTNKKKTESYSCNYHGDYSIDPKPTTFDEAIQAYKKLNDESTKKSPKSLIACIVPLIDVIKFYGLELHDPIPRTHQVDSHLLSKAHNLLKKLRKTTLKLKELAEHAACTRLECLKDQVNYFADVSTEIEMRFKTHIFKLIPGIRSCSCNENELKKAIKDGETEFSKKVNLEATETTIDQFLCYLKDIDEVKTSNGGPRIKITPKVGARRLKERVLCFAFNDAANIGTKIDPKLLSRFIEFAKANLESETSFTVVVGKNRDISTGKPGTVLYSDDEPVPFDPPSVPEEISLSIVEDKIKLLWKEPKFGADHIDYYIIHITNRKWKRPRHGRTNNNTPSILIPKSVITVSLEPNQEFTFSIRAVTRVGRGPEEKFVWKVPIIVDVRVRAH
jgi:hypothetical protein